MVYFVVCAQMAIVNQQKKIAFIASCLGMLVFGITIVTLGSVAPALKQRFLLDDLEIGTLFSILPVGLILGSLIIGPVLFLGCLFCFLALVLVLSMGQPIQ